MRRAPYNWIALAGVLGILLCCLQLALADIGPNSGLKGTDLFQWYAAGRMVLDGRAGEIYDPPEQHVYAQARFMQYADALLPSGPPNFDGNFVYPPAMALLMVPFSFLPFRACLIVWQVLSLVGLATAAWVFKKASMRAQSVSTGLFVVMSFCSFYMGSLFLLGQVGILLGLLPFTLGYLLCRARRPIWAGVALIPTALKPTFLVPAAIVCVAIVLTCQPRRDGIKLIGSLGIGIALVYLLPLIVFGGDAIGAWLHTLKLFAPAAIDAPHPLRHFWYLIALPATIAFTLPPALRAHTTSVLSVYTAVVTLVELVLATVIMRRAGSFERQVDIAFFTMLALLPICSPYLGNADTTVILLAAWIYVYQLGAGCFRVPKALLAAALILANLFYFFIPQLVVSGAEPLCLACASFVISAAVISACVVVYRQTL